MTDNRYFKEKLEHEYGVYVKKVRIWSTSRYWGEVFYLPYTVAGCNAGSVVMATENSKYYRSISAIYRDAESGVLFGKKKETK